MRTHNNLFSQVASFSALYQGYEKSRLGKKTRLAHLRFRWRLEDHLLNLKRELLDGTYTTGPYHSFLVYEPKTRVITALKNFRDRVVQATLMGVLEPIFERTFIFDSYACRKNKGTHAGADRAQEFLRRCLRKHGQVYALKADIRKYFASIHHDTLKRLLRRKISDERILRLLDDIIDSYHEPGRPGYGIPIGNLTSQLFANVYLDLLDHHVKSRLSEAWYIRYVDDFVVIGPDKAHLQKLKRELEAFVGSELHLEFNHKTQVFPIAVVGGRGLDFLGFHIWPHKRRLRKSSLCRFKKRVREIQYDYWEHEIDFSGIHQQLTSWVAHAKHGDAIPALSNYLGSRPFIRGHGRPWPGGNNGNRNLSTRSGVARRVGKKGHGAQKA